MNEPLSKNNNKISDETKEFIELLTKSLEGIVSNI